MSIQHDVPVLAGSLVRLEPLTTEHAGDLAEAAEEDRASYGFTLVPRGAEVPDYVAAQLSRRGLTPFAQVMAGVSRSTAALPGGAFSDSTTGFGLTPGVGADYRLTGRWAVRGQAELVVLKAAGVWDKDPRLGVGAVYRLGH